MVEDYGLWRYNTSFEEFKKNFGASLSKYGLDGEQIASKMVSERKPIGLKALVTTSDGREVPVVAYEDDYDVLRGDEIPYDAETIKCYNFVKNLIHINNKHDLKYLIFTQYLESIWDCFNNCESLRCQDIVWGDNGERGVSRIEESFACSVSNLNTGTTSVSFPSCTKTFDLVFGIGFENLTSVTINSSDYAFLDRCAFDNNSVSRTGVTTVRAYCELHMGSNFVCGLTNAGTIYVPSKYREYYTNAPEWKTSEARNKLRYF